MNDPELLAAFESFKRYADSLESSTQLLWNGILTVNSIFLSVFAIGLSVRPQIIKDHALLFCTFSTLPIILILGNMFFARLGLILIVNNVGSFINCMRFGTIDYKYEKAKSNMTAYAKTYNCIQKITESIAIICTITTVIYAYFIIRAI